MRRLTIFTYILVFTGFQWSTAQVATLSSTDRAISKERLSHYHDFLEKEIDQEKIPGAVSLIWQGGKEVDNSTFGYRDWEAKTPMSADQIFFIQSMTKPIISVAFMMLYEEGHFSLNDPVKNYLPAFESLKVATDLSKGAESPTQPIKEDVKIWHLLSHTAGFSHGLGGSVLDQDILRALYFQPQANIESRVNTLLSLPLIGQPGEQWYYSASPDVLAVLIEHFSGMSADKFLETRLFGPLGMDDTGYNLDAAQVARKVTLHTRSDGSLKNSPRQPPTEGNTVYGGTHGLFSTAADYMKFCRMMLNGGEANGYQLLSPKTIELMTMNHLGDVQREPGEGFGLGFGVTTDISEGHVLGSPGQYYWSGAYCTYFFIDPKEDLIAIMMTQLAEYSGYHGRMMKQLIYQSLVPE